MILTEQLERPIPQDSSENIMEIIEDKDIVMFGSINGVDGIDVDEVVELAGEGQLHGCTDKLGDSDEDSSSEASPGPEAWLDFQ